MTVRTGALAGLVALAALAACDAPPRASGTMALPATEATAPPVVTAAPSSPSTVASMPSAAPASPVQAASPAPVPSASAALASPSPTPTPTPTPSAFATTGLMVPLYTRPTHESWAALIAIRERHPTVGVVAIVNPGSGPGAVKDPAYDTGIARLTAAGIRAIGYVSTDYGARPANAIALDFSRWRQHYPAVDGVFLDEVPTNPSQRFHYGQVVADARRHGFKFVVGNPGISTDAAFAEQLDVLIAYEQPGWPGPNEPAADLATRFGKARFGMLAYATPAFTPEAVAAASARFGWLYVTEDDQPNPWDTLSAHAEAIADSQD